MFAMPSAQKLDTHRKALTLNLDPSTFGSFAEIGAGQEVARWFLLVGGASGTVAKTISAYDKEVSDAMRRRLRRSLTAVAKWCQEHRHAPVDQQQKTLNAKLRGHYQYYGRPTNSQSLLKFYRGVVRIWRKWLNRRTRGNRMTWERYKQLLRRYPLLSPQIRHPWTYPESPA